MIAALAETAPFSVAELPPAGKQRFAEISTAARSAVGELCELLFGPAPRGHRERWPRPRSGARSQGIRRQRRAPARRRRPRRRAARTRRLIATYLRHQSSITPPAVLGHLTDRERDVLRQIGLGGRHELDSADV